MRLELTRVGLLVGLANHYTTTGANIYFFMCVYMHMLYIFEICICIYNTEYDPRNRRVCVCVCAYMHI